MAYCPIMALINNDLNELFGVSTFKDTVRSSLGFGFNNSLITSSNCLNSRGLETTLLNPSFIN